MTGSERWRMKYGNNRKGDKRQRLEQREQERQTSEREAERMVSKVLDEKSSPSRRCLWVYESGREKPFPFGCAVQMDMLTLHITRLPPRTFCKDASIFTPHQSSHYSKQIPHLSGLAKHERTRVSVCVYILYISVCVCVCWGKLLPQGRHRKALISYYI